MCLESLVYTTPEPDWFVSNSREATKPRSKSSILLTCARPVRSCSASCPARPFLSCLSRPVLLVLLCPARPALSCCGFSCPVNRPVPDSRVSSCTVVWLGRRVVLRARVHDFVQAERTQTHPSWFLDDDASSVYPELHAFDGDGTARQKS
jgi:hypothetical protein